MTSAIEVARLLLKKLRGRSAKRIRAPGYSVVVWAGSERAPRFVTYCADRDATLEDHAVIVRGLVDPRVELGMGRAQGACARWNDGALTAARRCAEHRFRSPGPLQPHLERKMRGARERKGSRRATKTKPKQQVVVIFAE